MGLPFRLYKKVCLIQDSLIGDVTVRIQKKAWKEFCKAMELSAVETQNVLAGVDYGHAFGIEQIRSSSSFVECFKKLSQIDLSGDYR